MAVPGNWEFAYRYELITKLQERFTFPITSLNLKDTRNHQYVFNPYIIKEIDSLRLGIIGSIYPYVQETMPSSFSQNRSFSLGTEELSTVIQKLKDEERADLIVVVSHMGLPLDVKLASQIHGIDILLSGHSHDRISRLIIQNACIIMQSGASSSFLGKLDLTVKQGEVTNFSHELIPLYSEIYEEDAEIKSMIDELLLPYRDQLTVPNGTIRTLLHSMTLQEARIDRLITDAYLAYTDADFSFSHDGGTELLYYPE